jgi:hypothetical protein
MSSVSDPEALNIPRAIFLLHAACIRPGVRFDQVHLGSPLRLLPQTISKTDQFGKQKLIAVQVMLRRGNGVAGCRQSSAIYHQNLARIAQYIT